MMLQIKGNSNISQCVIFIDMKREYRNGNSSRESVLLFDINSSTVADDSLPKTIVILG